MSRHNPGFENRVRAFTALLSQHRQRQHMTQEEMADYLDLSRKTYVLYEQGRWLPGARQGHHMVHLLHRLDPALAVEYAKLFDTTVEWWGIAPPAPPQPATRLGAQHARSAYDASVYAAAEEAEIPAKLLRPVIAAVLASLQEAGMSLEQAAEVAKSAASAAQAKPSRGTGTGSASTRYRVDEAGEGAGAEGAGREGTGRRKA